MIMGMRPATARTLGTQYSSKLSKVSGRVTSKTRMTPRAPRNADSWIPLYPFCPRTSQIIRERSTVRFPSSSRRSRFVTFVPIVVM